MKKILGLVALLLVVSAPVYGASTITFGVLQGGDNHADLWASTGNPQLYTGGSAAAQTYDLDAGQTTLNWAVTVEAQGTVGADAIFGAANLVWNLEVWKDGSLVALTAGSPTAQGWYSTINDGDADAGQGVADPLQLAAFAWGFAGARAFDDVAASGPHMAQYTYPSAAGFPAASTATAGTLVGMGAGYTKFNGDLASERAYVGMTTGDPDGYCQALGTGPVAEGQINLTGLLAGDYTLKVVPGNGNNVLFFTNSYCDLGTNGSFAAKADVVQGAEITFTVKGGVPPCTAPVLTAAHSVKIHGTGVGARKLALNLTGAATVEPRNGGVSQIVLTYDKDIAAGAGGVVVTPSGAYAVSGTPAISGSTLTIDLTGSAERSCLTLTVAGVTCADTPGGAVSGTQTIKVAVGHDIDGNGQATSADALALKPFFSPFAPTDATAKYDIDLSGRINSADSLAVKPFFSPFKIPACTN